MKTPYVWAAGLAASATLLGFASQVVAEEAEADSLVLEEIVVTARKREESLQEVGMSLTEQRERMLDLVEAIIWAMVEEGSANATQQAGEANTS